MVSKLIPRVYCVLFYRLCEFQRCTTVHTAVRPPKALDGRHILCERCDGRCRKGDNGPCELLDGVVIRPAGRIHYTCKEHGIVQRKLLGAQQTAAATAAAALARLAKTAVKNDIPPLLRQ